MNNAVALYSVCWVALAIITGLYSTVGAAARTQRYRTLSVIFAVIFWPIGLPVLTALRNRRPGERLPVWLRVLIWFEALGVIMVLGGLYAKTAGQLILSATIIGVVAITISLWVRKRIGTDPRSKPNQSPEPPPGGSL